VCRLIWASASKVSRFVEQETLPHTSSLITQHAQISAHIGLFAR
jgi:hypothetical protein